MAKGKSTGKSKRDESAAPSRTSTRKRRIESPLASPVKKKTSRTSAKVRVRRSKSDDLEAVDSLPAKRNPRRVVKNLETTTLDFSFPATSDAPKRKSAKTALNLKKEVGDARPVRKTRRRKSDSTISESVDESTKKSGSKNADALLDNTTKKKTRKTTRRTTRKASEKALEKTSGKTTKALAKTNAAVESDSETAMESRKPVRRGRRKKTSDSPIEKIVKSRAKRNVKTESPSDFSIEAGPAAKKKRRGVRTKNSETRLSESDVAVEASDEKNEIKRVGKRRVKSVVVEPEETKTVVRRRRRKTTPLRKSLKTQEAVEEDEGELFEVVSEPRKKRVKKTVPAEVADEASEIGAKPRKKRAKKDEATDAVEKKRKVSRPRKLSDNEETSDAATSVDVADDGSSREAERSPEENNPQPISKGAAKKGEASRSETGSPQTSRPAGRRKSSGSSQTQSVRGLSNQTPDYLVLSVVNSFWLCAQWVVSDSTLNRVRSAMGRLWHTSEPILRVYRVDKSSHYTTIRREHVSDVVVKLPVRIWYAPVDNPPSSFMVELGYLSKDGEFFTLSSSGVVETSAHFIDDSTPLPPPIAPRWGIAGSTQRSSFGTASPENKPVPSDDSDFMFRRVESTDSFHAFGGVSLKVGAEVVIKGRVTPGAILKIRDERIVPKSNGFFAARLELPERRHVYPIVATSYDGSETQTIILAIDRNTKTLETVFRDDEE